MVVQGSAATLPVSPPPAHAKPFDVVGAGESSVDLVAVVDGFPTPDTKQPLRHFESRVGGQIATALVGAARLGCRARYFGALGDDAASERILGALHAEGIDTCVVRRPGAVSRFAIILVDATTGSRTVLERREETLALREVDVSDDVVTSGRVLLVDGHDAPVMAGAMRRAREAGVATVADVDESRPGLEALLASADVIIASGAFATSFTGAADVEDAIRSLATAFRCDAVVATLGDRGSVALLQGRAVRTPGFEVPVVDTTGAGDAFRAGFIAAWLRLGASALAATVLEYANATAALNCARLGAMDGLPSLMQVETLVTGSGHARSK